MRLGLVGLGLMGASLLTSLKHKRFFESFVGYSKTSTTVQQAFSLGLIDEILSLEDVIKTSDCLVLAVPVSVILDLMPKLELKKPNATIIDLGSTKSEIKAAIPASIRSKFILAHPMCGTEFSGINARLRDLYRNAVCVLCDTSENDKTSLELAEKMFLSMDMELVKMSATDHDKHASFISHMPHIVSFSIANSVLKQENKKNILNLAAGGFTSMSRLAKSSPTMWRDIFKQNKLEILEAMKVFEKEFKTAQKMLESNDFNALEAWMKDANKLYEIFKPKS